MSKAILTTCKQCGKPFQAKGWAQQTHVCDRCYWGRRLAKKKGRGIGKIG